MDIYYFKVQEFIDAAKGQRITGNYILEINSQWTKVGRGLNVRERIISYLKDARKVGKDISKNRMMLLWPDGERRESEKYILTELWKKLNHRKIEWFPMAFEIVADHAQLLGETPDEWDEKEYNTLRYGGKSWGISRNETPLTSNKFILN